MFLAKFVCVNNQNFMTVDLFQEKIARGEPLVGEEMIEFMREQSDLSRRILFELNGRYHTPEEICELFSQVIGRPVDKSFRLFPPYYTDFGKNIHIGKAIKMIIPKIVEIFGCCNVKAFFLTFFFTFFGALSGLLFGERFFFKSNQLALYVIFVTIILPLCVS